LGKHEDAGDNESEPMKQKSRTRQSEASEDAALVERLFTKLIKSSTMDKSRAKRFARLSRNLANTFCRVCPNVSPKLRGTVIALLLDVFDYSGEIKKDVQKLTRLKRPTDAKAFGSFLTDMQLLRLQHQQRSIADLLHNIPILLRSVNKGKGTQSTKRGLIDELADTVDS
jgi:hypothetical protein